VPGINQTIKSRRWAGQVEDLSPRSTNMIDYPRLPSFIFPLDYSLGGGFPCNVVSQIYGPWQSGKTTASYMTAKALSRFCMRCLQPLALCQCAEAVFGDHCGKCLRSIDECSCKPKCSEDRAVELCRRCKKNRIECTCGSQLIQKTVLVSFEGSPDKLYFHSLGYDSDENMVALVPEYGENGCEIVEAAAKSDDVGLVILDSLANMVPRTELESSYEDIQVALQARLVAKLFRRMSNILVREFRRGHLVSVLFLNQMRATIGGGGGRFAPSETTPGGFASKHGYRMSMRINQLTADKEKGEVDKTDHMKNVLRFSTSLIGAQSKQQLLIMAGKSEYKIVVRDYDDYAPGSVLDSTSAVGVARKIGLLEKGPRGYELQGTDLVFDKLSEIEEMFRTGVYRDQACMDDVFRHTIVKVAKERLIRNILRSGCVQVIDNPNTSGSE